MVSMVSATVELEEQVGLPRGLDRVLAFVVL